MVEGYIIISIDKIRSMESKGDGKVILDLRTDNQDEEDVKEIIREMYEAYSHGKDFQTV